jgi:N-acetylglucosaminyldiphosphoundecaprenol N-acetyl-beta-D-mannosaminyltransferase
MSERTSLSRQRVLTVRISLGDFHRHVQAIIDLARVRASAYVCCVNAHMTVEARDPAFAQVVDGARFATADGMPVVLALRWLAGVRQERVAGNDLMPSLLQAAEATDVGVYLYGGADATLARIRERAAKEYPRLRIVGSWSPPFGPLDGMDLEGDAARINASGAGIVMVSLGCPKQEQWMARMQGRVNGVMLGLGGAFLLYAGIDTRAPKWMRDLSLEWLYRLALEPRRLWKRYLVTNTLFLGMFLRAWVGRMFGAKGPGGEVQ